MSFRTFGIVALACASACGGRDGIAPAADGAADAGEVIVAPVTPAEIDAVPGAGCGRPLPPNTPPTVPGTPKGFRRFSVLGTGRKLTDTPARVTAGPRSFWVRVPADYDPKRPYRVVYDDTAGTASAEWEVFQLIQQTVDANDCVDLNHLYDREPLVPRRH